MLTNFVKALSLALFLLITNAFSDEKPLDCNLNFLSNVNLVERQIRAIHARGGYLTKYYDEIKECIKNDVLKSSNPINETFKLKEFVISCIRNISSDDEYNTKYHVCYQYLNAVESLLEPLLKNRDTSKQNIQKVVSSYFELDRAKPFRNISSPGYFPQALSDIIREGFYPGGTLKKYSVFVRDECFDLVREAYIKHRYDYMPADISREEVKKSQNLATDFDFTDNSPESEICRILYDKHMIMDLQNKGFVTLASSNPYINGFDIRISEIKAKNISSALRKQSCNVVTTQNQLQNPVADNVSKIAQTVETVMELIPESPYAQEYRQKYARLQKLKDMIPEFEAELMRLKSDALTKKNNLNESLSKNRTELGHAANAAYEEYKKDYNNHMSWNQFSSLWLRNENSQELQNMDKQLLNETIPALVKQYQNNPDILKKMDALTTANTFVIDVNREISFTKNQISRLELELSELYPKAFPVINVNKK